VEYRCALKVNSEQEKKKKAKSHWREFKCVTAKPELQNSEQSLGALRKANRKRSGRKIFERPKEMPERDLMVTGRCLTHVQS